MTSFRKGNIRLALHSLGATKGRSFLTMVGIIIGVAAVIVVVSIGQGVKQQLSTQSARFGKDVLVVRASTNRHAQSIAGISLEGGRSLSGADIKIIGSTPGVAQTVPIAVSVGAVTGDHTIDDPLIVATTPDFMQVVKHPMDNGGFFDADADSKTAVLGIDLARKLFDDVVPLGQTFTYRGEKFMVAGVFKRFAVAPLAAGTDYNQAAFIPYSTAQALLGTDPETYQVLARVAQAGDANQVAADMQARLVAAHGGTHDISVNSAERSNGNSDGTLQLLTMMTVGVAIIAFVVGGIGIMNVMLVSVTERTQEVGLRKAIGATNQQILRQFMAEALMLSVIGALIGVAAALATIGVLRLYSSLQPVPVWWVVVLAPLAAIATGVIFGTFPAIKAASKDPIEALRRQ